MHSIKRALSSREPMIWGIKRKRFQWGRMLHVCCVKFRSILTSVKRTSSSWPLSYTLWKRRRSIPSWRCRWGRSLSLTSHGSLVEAGHSCAFTSWNFSFTSSAARLKPRSTRTYVCLKDGNPSAVEAIEFCLRSTIVQNLKSHEHIPVIGHHNDVDGLVPKLVLRNIQQNYNGCRGFWWNW